VVGNPPTAAFPGGLHGTSTTGPPCVVFIARSTLACSFFGAPGSGQCGVFENVSASDAQVSNTTGEAFDSSTGVVNCVNNRQMNSSKFCVVPSTAPARAGTATTTVSAACGSVTGVAINTPAMTPKADLVMTHLPMLSDRLSFDGARRAGSEPRRHGAAASSTTPYPTSIAPRLGPPPGCQRGEAKPMMMCRSKYRNFKGPFQR